MADRFFDKVADVGSEEEDEEDFDEETGRVRSKKANGNANGGMDDSSEEDDDDDEEELRKAGEGFIADEDEEEDEEAKAARRRERKKRRREREEDEILDEDDLELIGERIPQPKEQKSKFKRLKQGHREDRRQERGGITDIFADEDEEMDDGRDFREPQAEFDDFIVEDEEGGDGYDTRRDREEVARPGRKFFDASGALDTSGMDPATVEDFKQAFYGDFTYDWVLDIEQDEEDNLVDRDQPIQLKDVFEDQQLKEKFLTEADIAIKNTDIPERYQLLRQPFKLSERSEEEAATLLAEEARWVFQLLWPKKSMESRFREPLQAAIKKVLEYINIDNFEVPFIFQHRKDYLIHEHKIAAEDSIDGRAETKAEKMLNQDDLWEILELDLRWKALIEKRDTLDKLYKEVSESHGVQDELIEELRSKAATNEEIQDIQDYFHFKYSAELKDVIAAETETNGNQKRARGQRNIWDKLRSSRVYQMVQAFGITAEAFALNATASGSRTYTEDPSSLPDDLSDELIDPPEFSTGAQVLRAAKAMFSEELITNPRLKRHMREQFYIAGQFHCQRTEKGARTITEDHRYFEFKYLRNQDLQSLMTKPELYLRMLQAEAEGLVEVKVTLINAKNFRQKLYSLIESDNYSAIAEAWNRLRREVLDASLDRLEKTIAKGVKEALRTECEQRLGKQIRLKYSEKLDQAPFKCVGLALGDKPRVMALSNGLGQMNRDAICWVQLDEDGRVTEHGKFVDLRPGNKEKYLPDGPDVKTFVELVKKHKPDVIGVSGFSPETRKLYKDLQELVDRNNLEVSETDDVENPDDRKLEVIIVNDECARLYHESERAKLENPSLPPISRYCIGLARYVQDPMLEYAALGANVKSLSFDPNQDLLPEEKLMKWLETAMVDMVNLVGVDLDEAYGNAYMANLLPYVCGLGPRKTDQLIRAIQKNGGVINSRAELLGDETIVGAVGPIVWQNCASFFAIDVDERDSRNADYLDTTRIHPEDYDIARKMAADALELDEEDIKAETDDGGPSAVVRKLVKEDAQDKVNDLVLEEYADQLEERFHQRKRATLETIRAELQSPFEELRASLAPMSSEDVFAMLTGETEESLVEGMIVPVTIRRIFQDHIECKLDNGLEGGIGAEHYPEGVGSLYPDGRDPRSVYHSGQVVQAIVQYLNKRALTCQLSLRGDLLRKPFRKRHTITPGEWDEDEEKADKRSLAAEREAKSGRAQRVIKHPLFKPFTSSQAEEFLGSQGRGDCVIRPSSKGLDHLAVTWKVSDNVYQHIDVVELDKENEFALGKKLKVGTMVYSDLDELIQLHVRAMARKTDEITLDERFQQGSRKDTEQWLEAYVEANPRRSMYAFCINRDYPGYFNLCFKPGPQVPVQTWPVKVIPNGFEMRKNVYPDMQGLKNGFKLIMQSQRMTHR